MVTLFSVAVSGNPFSILNLDEKELGKLTADDREAAINRAYRTAVKTEHSDRCKKEKEVCNSNFIQLTNSKEEAIEIVKNPNWEPFYRPISSKDLKLLLEEVLRKYYPDLFDENGNLKPYS